MVKLTEGTVIEPKIEGRTDEHDNPIFTNPHVVFLLTEDGQVPSSMNVLNNVHEKENNTGD